MIKSKDGDFFVSDWLRNRNTVEFLGIWEELHNPDFNYGEFAIITQKAWLHNYKISVQERCKKTHAIGIFAKSWRYGWTYAHKDIAFEFGMRISPRFKICLIKEFQRIKEQEFKGMDRNTKRFLTKINYKIHTDAIKDKLIPKKLTMWQKWYIYADEADILNVALFWKTAKERKAHNPDNSWNMRDWATIEQLIVLANLESLNAEFIRQWMSSEHRIDLLNKSAIQQMKSLIHVKSLTS